MTGDWPLFGLVLRLGGVELRPVREGDLDELARIEPNDAEHDPASFVLPGIDARRDRRRQTLQRYWRALGTWTPDDWCLDLAVRRDGVLVGWQTLEGPAFTTERTVDSASWNVPSVRGQGVGIAMRTCVLELAFRHLGARAAVSSAVTTNGASLGVSRSLGYRDTGVTPHDHAGRREALQHLRLGRDEWRAGGRGREVTIDGFAGCEPWFGLRRGSDEGHGQ